jgi:hypothetical protein
VNAVGPYLPARDGACYLPVLAAFGPAEKGHNRHVMIAAAENVVKPPEATVAPVADIDG